MIEMKMRTSASTEDIVDRLRIILPRLREKFNPKIIWSKDGKKLQVYMRDNISRRSRFTLYRDSPDSLDVTVHVGTETFDMEWVRTEELGPQLTDLVGPVVSTWMPFVHKF